MPTLSHCHRLDSNHQSINHPIRIERPKINYYLLINTLNRACQTKLENFQQIKTWYTVDLMIKLIRRLIGWIIIKNYNLIKVEDIIMFRRQTAGGGRAHLLLVIISKIYARTRAPNSMGLIHKLRYTFAIFGHQSRVDSSLNINVHVTSRACLVGTEVLRFTSLL